MSDLRLVHIVDDEDSVRRAVGFALRTSGFDVRAYPSGVRFLKEARTAAPGCVLLDIRMPDMDGLEVQRELNNRAFQFPVIMLTGHGDIAMSVQAMKAGAVDFLEKPFEKASLLAAIEAAFERLENHEAAAASQHEASLRIAALTPREQDVLRGLVRGHPNKTIAYDLDISPRTIEVHRANLMIKLGARSLSDALRIAFAAGLDG
jgi:two-component system response regulator FixJ